MYTESSDSDRRAKGGMSNEEDTRHMRPVDPLDVQWSNDWNGEAALHRIRSWRAQCGFVNHQQHSTALERLRHVQKICTRSQCSSAQPHATGVAMDGKQAGFQLNPVPLAWSITQAVQTASDIEPWRIRLMLPSYEQHVEVAVGPAISLRVTDEYHATLPMFDGQLPGWARGSALKQLAADECTTPGLLKSDSVTVRLKDESFHCSINSDQRATSNSAFAPIPLVRNKDYAIDDVWGTIGCLSGGALDPTRNDGASPAVLVSYEWTPLRLDSLVLTANKHIELRQGQPCAVAPPEVPLFTGEQRLMNIWLPGRASERGLSPASLFPILESELDYPQDDKRGQAYSGSLPRTLSKLRAGQDVNIVVWGDEVTEAKFLECIEDRWQEQFLRALRERFLGATISLHTTAVSLQFSIAPTEPPSVHGVFRGCGPSAPDLVITEFSKDVSMAIDAVHNSYRELAALFRLIGSEWALLTPAYVRAGPRSPCSFWMLGMEAENGLVMEEDPRPYTTALRSFVAECNANNPEVGVALADASRLWGRMYRLGIPYTTLLSNSIDHPNRRGMAIFARAVLALLTKGQTD